MEPYAELSILDRFTNLFPKLLPDIKFVPDTKWPPPLETTVDPEINVIWASLQEQRRTTRQLRASLSRKRSELRVLQLKKSLEEDELIRLVRPVSGGRITSLPRDIVSEYFKTMQTLRSHYDDTESQCESLENDLDLAEQETERMESDFFLKVHKRNSIASELEVGAWSSHPLWQYLLTQLGSFLETTNTKITELSVVGDVLGTLVTANPDTGADGCFISSNMAAKLGLYPAPGTESFFRVANGRKVSSPGVVEVPWKFIGEPETYPIICRILPVCAHDIILGSKFLDETETMTTFREYRVKRRLGSVPGPLRVLLLGEGKQRLMGCFNGNPVAALPDTGSDVMVISRKYARKLGLPVDKSPECIVEVEFGGGLTALTDGMVRQVAWSVGGTAIIFDFFVLDGLCVDVILSKDYVFDQDVFREFSDYIIEDHITEDNITEDEVTPRHLELCGIRLLRTFGAALNQLAEESIEDVTSLDAFSPPMIDREWARRDRIRDEIDNLPLDQRGQAKVAETERQREWNEARAAHRQRWGQATSSSSSSGQTDQDPGPVPSIVPQDEGRSTGSSRNGGSPPVQGQPSEGKRTRWRRMKKIRLSIPLQPLSWSRSSRRSGPSD